MKIIERYKKLHEFNAENCRRKQQLRKDEKFVRKIKDIRARIDFVVSNSNDEHAVIYCVDDDDRDMYVKIGEYFEEKGFISIITNIEGLDNEYLIISW